MEQITVEDEGNIVIAEITYSGQTISFKNGQELMIQYTKFKNDPIIYVDYDFGMTVKETSNYITNPGFLGICENTTVKDIVLRTVKFDIEHAFCHPSEDPNYTELHWAILGWLKDRVIVTENDDF